jgi:hypothetical protein
MVLEGPTSSTAKSFSLSCFSSWSLSSLFSSLVRFAFFLRRHVYVEATFQTNTQTTSQNRNRKKTVQKPKPTAEKKTPKKHEAIKNNQSNTNKTKNEGNLGTGYAPDVNLGCLLLLFSTLPFRQPRL